jgi:hypothetical protein
LNSKCSTLNSNYEADIRELKALTVPVPPTCNKYLLFMLIKLEQPILESYYY